MIIGLFPGQGSQTPGFLSPWLELDGVATRLDELSEAAQVDLAAAGTEWDADAIRDTKVAQPLIVAASLISWHALVARAAGLPAGVAGHSVGEVAALAASGVIDDVSALRLVGVRGRAMADAAAQAETGMSAVLGGDEEAVLARLAELDLTPANYNGGGQIVAAGAVGALAELAAEAPRGTRVVALQVAGAFHTRYMQPAVEELAAAAAELTASDPTLTLWTNKDGSEVTDGASALDLLVGQVASPVRWDLDMAAFAEAGATGLIEFAPAGTLTGLAKRGLRGVPAVAVKTPDDLDAAVALLSEENA
ncbi:ACP S-malonyltransferase [Microbacterium sp. BG28]|uniref:ACP S-malonyltransferase n=1 Tax=Microbacterium sp. BG28 TaxID=3097356 RepID=UPI002A5A6838|nr:ACP S-malonyltransferase [Microbacterium sp. BG28]MDY0829424.1 ACP S-malonyltransferase [Microbacterium sp. BG28]